MIAYRILLIDLLESGHSKDSREDDINMDIRETDCEEVKWLRNISNGRLFWY
jgi:hypothetical protein